MTQETHKNQVALVTGAAQGLGKAIAKSLFDAGFAVVITDANESGASATALEIDATQERVMALKLDVLHKSDFSDALDAAVVRFGKVDALVNNAAMTPTTPVMEITAEEFDKVVSVNMRGTFFGCQVFGQYFASNGYGRIVNLASLAGQNGGTASGAHYASSKGAILTMTKIFARQLAESGVTVNSVAPGPIDLPSVRALVPPERLEQIINEMIPVKALGNAEFVADMVTKLASPEASFVTGAAWDVNGGIFMR
ncbi:SDR family NAD(P)-dependent oxidoreductase [uncultured Amphritea sp.]|uniref:SDR family NAD(P)-dependent oxidoreductase n=1 Tax=uncultured Amphritea sp. TaxID=981605 RepID=UPI002621638D|nr:SDR family NAD(P)-dependent oxidoreductase [uncultured Amphritea sp.]